MPGYLHGISKDNAWQELINSLPFRRLEYDYWGKFMFLIKLFYYDIPTVLCRTYLPLPIWLRLWYGSRITIRSTRWSCIQPKEPSKVMKILPSKSHSQARQKGKIVHLYS